MHNGKLKVTETIGIFALAAHHQIERILEPSELFQQSGHDIVDRGPIRSG